MVGSDGQVDMTVRRFCCRLGTCFQFQYIKMCFLIAVAGECYKARKIKRRRCAKKKKKKKRNSLQSDQNFSLPMPPFLSPSRSEWASCEIWLKPRRTEWNRSSLWILPAASIRTKALIILRWIWNQIWTRQLFMSQFVLQYLNSPANHSICNVHYSNRGST